MFNTLVLTKLDPLSLNLRSSLDATGLLWPFASINVEFLVYVY